MGKRVWPETPRCLSMPVRRCLNHINGCGKTGLNFGWIIHWAEKILDYIKWRKWVEH